MRRAQSRVKGVESGDVDHTEPGSVWYECGGLNEDDAGGEDLGEPGSPRYESTPLNDNDDVDLPPPYTQYAAEREGVTDRTVRNRLRIAEKLYPEVRNYVRANIERG